MLMYDRNFHTVFALLGPASDRDGTKIFFEQAGYTTQVYKNPEVFFDELKFAKNPIVILETFALKFKLSDWVKKLLLINQRVGWLAVAPISQYSIIASYQNRGLVEFVQNDQPYLLERLLWAVDRQANKEEVQQNYRRVQEELIFARRNQMQAEPEVEVDFNLLLKRKFHDFQKQQKPFTLLALALDDEKEVQEFWGKEILKKANELVLDLCVRRWGLRDVQVVDGRTYVMIPKATNEVLKEAVELQTQLQDLARQDLGFRVSLSAGIAESYVHTNKAADLRRLTEEALRHMQTKGGGRVGIPKAIRGGINGDVPTNLG
jgi:GGDEF domain-containing protein